MHSAPNTQVPMINGELGSRLYLCQIMEGGPRAASNGAVPMWRAARILVMTALVALTAACESGPPPSPAEQALQRRFEMGCRPQDSVGYERARPYCDDPAN
jgi:hypothetical protein